MGTGIISPALRTFLNELRTPDFEDDIPYMYVDSEGKITVGVGHNLSAHRDVLKLKFITKRRTRKAVKGGDQGVPLDAKRGLEMTASTAEIQNDYDFLVKNNGLRKYLPTQLEAYTTLELPASDIDSLFDSDLAGAIAAAKKPFGIAFDGYPESAKAALIDIAFNTGNVAGFQILVMAILGSGSYGKQSMSDRWKVAARESKRGQVKPRRNTVVEQWFLDAAKASK